ncbi:MAG: heme-copper oxidase subunit III [Nitrospinae bacterium]|nr:heme-copper oxidase subunit III [Nitrospinota bacterium]
MTEHSSEHTHGWETSPWPLPLAAGILFLLPLPFSFHFVYKNSLMAMLSLGLGVPMVIISVAGWTRESLEDKYGWASGYIVGAMPFFIIAEAFIFIAFLAAYWVIKLSAGVWPPPGTPEFPVLIPIIMTIILVSSSITIHIGEGKLEEGDKEGFIKWLGLTILLGTVFLCFTAFEWSHFIHEGFLIGTNAKGTVFYSITGFHASHVFVGLAIFLCILLPAIAGKVSKPFVQAGSIYWHFVDIVWFFVVSQVYFW